MVYKYKPENFRNMPFLVEDFQAFYKSREEYKKNQSFENKFTFRQFWETLFFSIKHREVEGYLDPATAQEMRDYLEELAND